MLLPKEESLVSIIIGKCLLKVTDEQSFTYPFKSVNYSNHSSDAKKQTVDFKGHKSRNFDKVKDAKLYYYDHCD